MKLGKLRASHVLLVLATSRLALADQFLCVADKAAGFHFEKSSGAWEEKFFRSDSKWIVRKKKDGNDYEVVRMGEDSRQYECKRSANGDIFRCDGIGTFVMNSKTGRYEARGHEAYAYADALGGDEVAGDVWIEIGKCSSF